MKIMRVSKLGMESQKQLESKGPSLWTKTRNMRDKLKACSNRRQSVASQFRVHTFVRRFISNLKSCVAPRHTPPGLIDFGEEITEERKEVEHGLSDTAIPVRIFTVYFLVLNFVQCFFSAFLIGYEDFRVMETLVLAVQLVFAASSLAKIVVSFYIFREHEGLPVTELFQIQLRYFTSHFPAEVAILILELLCISFYYAAIPLFLLKHWQLFNSVKHLERSVIPTEAEKLWKLTTLIFFNLLIALNVAVVYTAMAVIYPPKTWMTKFEIDQNPWWNKFIWAIYWSVTTTMTVGFGDITPANPYEAILVTFCELIGGIIYVYNINTIGNVLSAINEERAELVKKMKTLNGFFNREGEKFDLSLRNKIFNTVKNTVIAKKELSFVNEQEILEGLEVGLRSKVSTKLTERMLQSVNFLNQFSGDVKRELSKRLRPKVYYSNEVICEKNKPNKLVVIVERGVTDFFFKKFDSEVIVVKREATSENPVVLGLCSLLYRREFLPARVHGVCECYVLPLAELETLLKDTSRLDREKFCYQKDNSKFNTEAGVVCGICQLQKHSITVCPMYHYSPVRGLKFIRSRVEEEQARDKPPVPRRGRRRNTIYRFNSMYDEDLMDQEQEFDGCNNLNIGALMANPQKINQSRMGTYVKSLDKSHDKELSKESDYKRPDAPRFEEMVAFKHYNTEFNFGEVLRQINEKVMKVLVDKKIIRNKRLPGLQKILGKSNVSSL